MIQGNSIAARRRRFLQCSPQASARKQYLGERQVSDVLYQPACITGQEPLMVVPFEDMLKASTSLLPSTKGMEGKASRPVK